MIIMIAIVWLQKNQSRSYCNWADNNLATFSQEISFENLYEVVFLKSLVTSFRSSLEKSVLPEVFWKKMFLKILSNS